MLVYVPFGTDFSWSLSGDPRPYTVLHQAQHVVAHSAGSLKLCGRTSQNRPLRLCKAARPRASRP